MAKKVPGSVKRAIRGGLKEPRLADLATYFFAAAGGTAKVGKLLYEEFAAAKPGSLMRQRILEIIVRVTRFVNEQSGNQDDLGILSEDDLLNQLEHFLQSEESIGVDLEAIEEELRQREEAELAEMDDAEEETEQAHSPSPGTGPRPRPGDPQTGPSSGAAGPAPQRPDRPPRPGRRERPSSA